MLPFPKRNATDDEVELEDDDLELVEEPSVVESPQSEPLSLAERYARDAELAQTVQRTPRKHTIPPGSRRILDENVEEDVAGQCLASIAAATSHGLGRLDSSSHIRASIARRDPAPPPASSSYPVVIPPSSTMPPPADPRAAMSRLPSITAPPFVRTMTVPYGGGVASRHPEAPGIRESVPPPAAFVRRSSPALPSGPPSSYGALSRPTPDPSSARMLGPVASVAPVSVTQRPNEPTVIVLRERPKAAWIVAAAALGALGALVGSRVLGHPGDDRVPVAAVQAPLAPAALPSPVVTAPSSAVAAPSASHAAAPVPAVTASANVMHFADDQGVAFKAPAPAAAPAPAPRPVAVARPARPAVTGQRLGPALPDGSFGLGRAETTTSAPAAPAVTAAPAAPPPPASPPEPVRRRPLTPEQQLAEAQLKASMK